MHNSSLSLGHLLLEILSELERIPAETLETLDQKQYAALIISGFFLVVFLSLSSNLLVYFE